MRLQFTVHSLTLRPAQGAADFKFGQEARAFFGGNKIVVSNAGYITANGRNSDDGTSCKFTPELMFVAMSLSSILYMYSISTQSFLRPEPPPELMGKYISADLGDVSCQLVLLVLN
jgi:hypothetical protein